MIDSEKGRFAAELNMLAAALKGLVTEPMLMVFWEEFGAESLSDWRVACVKARRSLDFFPSVREMRSFLPAKPRPIDPLVARLLAPYERKEPWPDKPLMGTEEFPLVIQPEAEKSDLERAIEQRVHDLRLEVGS